MLAVDYFLSKFTKLNLNDEFVNCTHGYCYDDVVISKEVKKYHPSTECQTISYVQYHRVNIPLKE